MLIPSRRLDPPVDETRDHILGASDAPITLVEYGSYACPHCRVANETIASLRDRFGDRMRYMIRHRPLANNDLARRAAEIAEYATPEQFWKVHLELMTRSSKLTEDDLLAVKTELDLESPEISERARARVDEDERSANANGVVFTPTFFINGRRYDGPWDDVTLGDAMLGTLGHRVRATALDFASWGPSAGVLLFIATVLALVFSNHQLAMPSRNSVTGSSAPGARFSFFLCSQSLRWRMRASFFPPTLLMATVHLYWRS
ncbi:DsbA family protein [Mesorhizobium sp. M0408]